MITPKYTDYTQQIAIVQVLRKAFQKVKHHAVFSRRILKPLEAELPVGYTVYLNPNDGMFSRLAICVELSWCDTSRPWQKNFLNECDRHDYTDYMQRQADETRLLGKLRTLDALAKEAQQEAAELIAELPIPPGAIKRDWTGHGPTTELSKAFPRLFDHTEDR